MLEISFKTKYNLASKTNAAKTARKCELKSFILFYLQLVFLAKTVVKQHLKTLKGKASITTSRSRIYLRDWLSNLVPFPHVHSVLETLTPNF